MEKIFFCSLLILSFLSSWSSSYGVTEKEKTLAMIKPDGVRGNYADKIKQIILRSGFSITSEKMVHLDAKSAALFYAEHSNRSFFSSLIEFMTSGPVLVMVIEKSNAIADWRALIGPTDSIKARDSHPNSIRAMCGLNSSQNCVHGSDSPDSAAREISFLFGEMSDGYHDKIKMELQGTLIHDEL